MWVVQKAIVKKERYGNGIAPFVYSYSLVGCTETLWLVQTTDRPVTWGGALSEFGTVMTDMTQIIHITLVTWHPHDTPKLQEVRNEST